MVGNLQRMSDSQYCKRCLHNDQRDMRLLLYSTVDVWSIITMAHSSKDWDNSINEKDSTTDFGSDMANEN